MHTPAANVTPKPKNYQNTSQQPFNGLQEVHKETIVEENENQAHSERFSQ